MMIGRVSCGKTTLCQRLVGDPLVYKKTQTVEIIGQAIDTPGEYAENRRLMRGLTVSAVDADLIVSANGTSFCETERVKARTGIAKRSMKGEEVYEKKLKKGSWNLTVCGNRIAAGSLRRKQEGGSGGFERRVPG